MTTTKHLAIAGIACSLIWAAPGTASAQLGGALRGLGQKAADKATEKKPAPTPPPDAAPTPDPAPEPAAQADSAPKDAPPATAAAAAPTYKAYQNYDFVPGDKIVFEDNFATDTDGEFPAHWKLTKGQGVVNKVSGEPVFALTEGNYAVVMPRVTVPNYLSDPFTIEADFFPKAGGYERLNVFLKAGDTEATVGFGYDVNTENFPEDAANQSAHYSGDSEAFKDKWHHIALVLKNGQLKAYEDQYACSSYPTLARSNQSPSLSAVSATARIRSCSRTSASPTAVG